MPSDKFGRYIFPRWRPWRDEEPKDYRNPSRQRQDLGEPLSQEETPEEDDPPVQLPESVDAPCAPQRPRIIKKIRAKRKVARKRKK
jgi:hypothetical protein